MKLNKTLVPLLLATSIATPVLADPISVYGKANISAQSTDDGEGSFTELKSNASRFGVKGKMALDHGLSIFL